MSLYRLGLYRHTCATSYIHLTSVVPGTAVEHASDRKCAKYSPHPNTHDFVPVAIESLGYVYRTGRELLLKMGRGMTAISRGVQYVHWVMHTCIMVKVVGETKYTESM